MFAVQSGPHIIEKQQVRQQLATLDQRTVEIASLVLYAFQSGAERV